MLLAGMSDQRQPSPSPLPSSASAPSSPKPMSAPSPAAPPPFEPSTKTTPSASASSPAPAPPPASADHNPPAGSSSHPASPPSPSLPRAKANNADPSPSASASTSTANPKPAAAAAAGTASAVSAAGPAKIPSRPRKTRKLAAQAASPQGGAKPEEETASAGDGGGSSSSAGAIVVSGGAAPAEAGGSRPRVVYRVLPRPLSAEGEVAASIRRLREADPKLARVMEAHEPPVFQSLHSPFHSLARSILYQQLAFKAGASIYSRFLALCGGEAGVVPEAVLGLTPLQLRQIGVSARKASYLHDLANKYRNGILSDAAIVAMDDKSLFTMLTMVKGIGAWSVHMFMIFSLHRPDVLPVGDLGVRKGVQLLYSLDALPRPSQMEQLCEGWKPYRSVGSWYMWRLVEAKGAPAALATVPSIDTAVAAAAGGGGGGGVCGAPLVGGVPPPALPPLLPQQHQSLQRQVQQQPHPHLHPHQHQHQHQHQQQLQMQTQLVDAIQSIPNLG